MPNLFKPTQDILELYDKENAINKVLKNHHEYWAHSPNKFNNTPETLEEHLHLVQKYFCVIIKNHGLDTIIDNLINEYLNEKKLSSLKLGNWIKELFIHTVLYHDHGKINEMFQSERMGNSLFKEKVNHENGINSQHSTLSAFIFLNHKLNDAANLFKGNELNCAFTITILLSYPIYRHHSYHLRDDFWQKLINESKRVEQLEKYLRLFKNQHTNPQIIKLIQNIDSLVNRGEFREFENSFALYQLIRLSFSLLTSSDYLATNEFMNQFEVKDLGILTSTRIKQLFEKVTQNEWIDEDKTKRNFNKTTYDELEKINLSSKPKERRGEKLNLLRQQMATEAILNIRKNSNKNLFYLEAPTGGGKTNISMLLALELLKANKALNKVYYVFPFTTLIDQTFKSLKESLGLLNNEIVALHSRASFGKEAEGDEEDAIYGLEQKNYINRLFVNYPFTLLSHVRFFDLLKTNIKEENYLLHRLANSIVVIDELQSYNPDQWDKILFFIKKYANLYNIRFILMSATLPKITDLKIKNLQVDDVVYLLPNAKKEYFNNINFSGRVDFDYSLSNERISLDLLAQNVLSESKKHARIDGGVSKPKGSVYTVIEFIFKNATTVFEREIKKINDGFFDEIFVLSGTILTHRRKQIINYLKNRRNRVKKILLITTQVVEAGVDIDMDLGFKDSSLLDSDEQLAGRINRNVNKNNCKLFLFNYSKESIIYGKDLRYELTKEFTREEKENILKTKDFDYLYERVIGFKNKRNRDESFVGIVDYVNLIKSLQFQTVSDEFKLIKQENFSCFIPLCIPITINGEKENQTEANFNKSELNFLSENNIFPDVDNKICGELVFDLYISIIQSSKPFLSKRVQLKQIQSILSKYVFSLFASEKTKHKLIEFMDIEKSEYGYFYMNRWADFYSEISGIDEFAFENIENQFI